MKKMGRILILLLLVWSNVFPRSNKLFLNPLEYDYKECVTKQQKKQCFIPTLIREAFELHMNLFFSADSFKIATGFFPFYVAGRMIDKKLQSCFYDAHWHRNCCQLPFWCNDLAKVSISIPIVVLGSWAFFGKTEEIRSIGRVFLVGMPFVVFGKDVLKKWQAEHCLRPKHEKFCCWKKYYGGFPSGHMAEITYMTVLFGVRFGAPAAIPLGILSLFVAGTFLNCNRHYLSEIVAGAALGTMYAMAANNVIERELSGKKFCLGFDCDQCGNPAINLACAF